MELPAELCRGKIAVHHKVIFNKGQDIGNAWSIFLIGEGMFVESMPGESLEDVLQKAAALISSA